MGLSASIRASHRPGTASALSLAVVALALACRPEEPAQTPSTPAEGSDRDATLECGPVPTPSDPEATRSVLEETRWLMESDATELRARMAAGSLSPAALRDAVVQRIEASNERGPELRALIAIDAAAEPSPDTSAGPLHGLPIALKDNIDAVGFPTTAGSLALANNLPADDAFLTARLRNAGATVVAKANLSEWANFRSTRSTSGWSGVGGLGRNPHDIRRSQCGSSAGSGAAVAAGLVTMAVGTETDGSILCPASMNGIVGVKPTVGLVSRDGIVPISPTQDTAGPMTRSVRDAALLLEVLAAPDASDVAPHARPPGLDTRYVAGLDRDGLQGRRVGVLRSDARFEDGTKAVFEAALSDLEKAGAELVEIEASYDDSVHDHEWTVLTLEFAPAMAAYLSSADPNQVAARTLEDLIEFNRAHAAAELCWFDQSIFEISLRADRDSAADPASLERARTAARRLLGDDFLDRLAAEHRVEAFVYPTADPAWTITLGQGDDFGAISSSITAIPGYPAITVPMGEVEGLPVGLTFAGLPWTEGRLLAFAFAYEQISHARIAPTFRH